MKKKKKNGLGSRVCPRCEGIKSIGAKRCKECAGGHKGSRLTNSPYRRKDFVIYMAENGKNNNIRELPKILQK